MNNQSQPRQEKLNWLLTQGLTILPVAPAQCPYQYPVTGKTKEGHSYCIVEMVEEKLTPKPLFTGKNPSYLNSDGKPKIISHGKYQKTNPTPEELNNWFASPLNGIGILHQQGQFSLDLDRKHFPTDAECENALETILEKEPSLNNGLIEQTQSGGYRIVFKSENQPDFTNFSLTPNGEHIGELLGKGRFAVLAPTKGVNGKEYTEINRPEKLPIINNFQFVHPTKTKKKSNGTGTKTPKPKTTEWTPNSINLDLLLNQTARDILSGKNIKDDRSESLTTLINEAWGWYYWCQDNRINVTGTVEELAHHAGSQLGIDTERIERILKGINGDTSLQPSAQHRGGDSSCWKKIHRLDRATFESLCPDQIKNSIKSEWNGSQKQNHNHQDHNNHSPSSSNQSDNNSNNNNQSQKNKVNWKEPKSHLRTMGYWKKEDEDNYEWQPRCNFDFTIERELTSELGGGFVLQLVPETEEKQYRVMIKSSDLASPDKFVDALKRALGFVVVCSLSKRELNALIAAKQAEYRNIQRGKKYLVCDRYGQQQDGLWVFNNIQFKPDGTITNENESLTVFDPNLGKEDYIPCPKLAEFNGIEGLDQLIKAGRKVFTGNVEQFLLTLGWVTAGLHFQTIQKIEGMFPLLDANGNPGSGKTLASEAALSLVGTNWAANGMVSKVSLSAIYELLSRTGSLPFIWDDPPRGKDALELDEFCKAMWNAKPRMVRGNKQEPHSPIGFTSNHQLGGEQPSAYTRFVRIFFDCKGNINAIPELKEAQKIASGSFPELIKIGYDAEAVKKIMESYLPSLTFANERIAWSLALITWYTEQLLSLVGGTDDIEQWVIDNLLASENDAENSGDALTHFIQCLEALESKDLVGSWNKREFIDANGKKWMAIFATNAWAEVNKAFSPCTYNKKSLKAHILRVGGIVDKTVKFDASRDEVLDYRREMRRISIEIPGEEIKRNLPKPPQQKTRRAWMIPIELYTGEDDGGSHNPTPPPPSPDSGNNLTQDKSPSQTSNNVTSQNDCSEPDSDNQSSSSNKLTENASKPSSKNVTSQNDCSEPDSSTQSFSDNKLSENASLQSPKKVTSQNDCSEVDSSTQFSSGNKLSEIDSEPSPQNMMSQSNFPEADSSTQSSSGKNLTQDESPSQTSNNVTSQNNYPEPDSSTQSSSSNKLTENASEPSSKNVTSQNDCSELDSSTQSFSNNKLSKNASLPSPKKVTNQNDYYEADLSTQSTSGNKLSEIDSEPCPQNMMSQSNSPEADSSTQSSSGKKLSQKLSEKNGNCDLTHPTKIDFMAYQNRVMECKKRMLACTNRSTLTAFCSSAGFDYREILWVWENLLTTDEQQKINQAVSNNSQNVSETEPLSQTGLHPSQKNVTPNVTDCDFCYLVTELAQSQEKNSPIANTFSNETQVTEKEVTTEADANQEYQPVTPAENQCLTEVTEYNPDSEEEHQVSPQPVDWIELLEGIDQEMKRLDWSVEHGVDYLLHKYQKKSRQLLTDEEAIEFYEFLLKRKSKYVVGDKVIVTHASPEFNDQIADVVSVLPNKILKVQFNGDRVAREVCGVYVRHYFFH